MAFTTVYKNIIFSEGDIAQAQVVGNTEADLSFKIGAQMKTLRDVKDKLAEDAVRNNCNAVINFTYGQKSRWLAIDDVAYWGKGQLAMLDAESYKTICDKCGNN